MPSYRNTFNDVQEVQGLNTPEAPSVTATFPSGPAQLGRDLQTGNVFPAQGPAAAIPFQGSNQINTFQGPTGVVPFPGSTQVNAFQGPSGTVPFKGSDSVVGFPSPSKVVGFPQQSRGSRSETIQRVLNNHSFRGPANVTGPTPAINPARLGRALPSVNNSLQSPPDVSFGGQSLYNSSNQQVLGSGLANPDTVGQRYDGGLVVDGSRGVAGTGQGFNIGPTDFGQYGENVNGVPTLKWDANDNTVGLKPQELSGLRQNQELINQRVDAIGRLPVNESSSANYQYTDNGQRQLVNESYNTSIPSLGFTGNTPDPYAPQRLGILQQNANTQSQTADNDRFKQAYTTTTDIAGNVTKIPDGTFDSRTGLTTKQNAQAQQRARDNQRAANEAAQQAEEDEENNRRRNQQQAQADTLNAKKIAAQGKARKQNILNAFNSNSPEKRRIAAKYFGGQ